MIEPNGLPAFGVDGRLELVAKLKLALFNQADMDDGFAAFLRVLYAKEPAFSEQAAGVADLPTTLGIERC